MRRPKPALRESLEEIGLRAGTGRACGRHAFITITGYEVTGGRTECARRWNCARCQRGCRGIQVPLQLFLDPANFTRHRYRLGGKTGSYLAVTHENHFIWGATAAMLLSLGSLTQQNIFRSGKTRRSALNQVKQPNLRTAQADRDICSRSIPETECALPNWMKPRPIGPGTKPAHTCFTDSALRGLVDVMQMQRKLTSQLLISVNQRQRAKSSALESWMWQRNETLQNNLECGRANVEGFVPWRPRRHRPTGCRHQNVCWQRPTMALLQTIQHIAPCGTLPATAMEPVCKAVKVSSCALESMSKATRQVTISPEPISAMRH